jgi:ABC-type transport system substrate-binding protein/tetratricopeptide (TPR) repeat protein
LLLAFAGIARAEDGELPLLQQDPYDIIRLDASNGHAEVKVEPLKFLDRKIPASPKSTDVLEVNLFNESDKGPMEIEWKNIEKIILYEDRVLIKAVELAADKKPEDAYDHFKFLFETYPNTSGLKTAYENFLYEEAKQSHVERRYDDALSLLRQIHSTNPKRANLDKAMGMATEKLVEQYIAQNRFNAARSLILELTRYFPESPVAAKWSEQLKKKADEYLREGQAATQKGDWDKASEQSRLLTILWPALPGAKELAKEIQEKNPRAVVGVMTEPRPEGTNTFSDWAARRDRRLFYRTLMEYQGPGMDGGRYICPVGKCVPDTESLGRRIIFQIRPDIRWAEGDATLTSYDVARRLVALADHADPSFRGDWAELMKAVNVRSVAEFDVDFRRLHVRPESMLQTVLYPYAESSPGSGPAPTNGPFVLPRGTSKVAQSQTAAKNPSEKGIIPPATTNFSEMTFFANTQYFATKPAMPKELLVRRYPTGPNAIHALKQGDIQILDRIAPWNLSLLKNNPKISVGKYSVPLVHCLVPNFNRPLMKSRTYRRALAYGLNRDAILKQLVGNEPIEGCRVVSGPFSSGISNDDPLNYAYDERILPRPCDPRMTLALAGVSLKEYKESEKKQGREVKKLPRLVLAYPDDEIAAVACASIKYQLNCVHIEVDLRPLKGPAPDRVPDDVDLLYAELSMGEPIADAGRLFGENGLASGSSPYVALGVKQLQSVSEWTKIREQLHRLHRIVHDDVTILPLWQLVDFYAYRKGNRGIGEKPYTIYQNLEQWQPAFTYPEGE